MRIVICSTRLTDVATHSPMQSFVPRHWRATQNMVWTSRLIGIAAALVVIGLGVFGWQTMRAPTSTVSVASLAPTRAEPAPTHSAPTLLAHPNSNRSAPTKPPAATRAASAAEAPAIGSEGYGPHIEAAHSGGDPALALRAFRLLRLCRSIPSMMDSIQRRRDNEGSNPGLNAMARGLELDSHSCQTVTAEHQAWAAELLTAAYEARVPEAAAELSRSNVIDTYDSAALDKLIAALHGDADAGEQGAMMSLYAPRDPLRIPLEDRAVYAKLFWDMNSVSPSGSDWMNLMYASGVKPADLSQLDLPSIEGRADQIRAAFASKGIMPMRTTPSVPSTNREPSFSGR